MLSPVFIIMLYSIHFWGKQNQNVLVYLVGLEKAMLFFHLRQSGNLRPVIYQDFSQISQKRSSHQGKKDLCPVLWPNLWFLVCGDVESL